MAPSDGLTPVDARHADHRKPTVEQGPFGTSFVIASALGVAVNLAVAYKLTGPQWARDALRRRTE